MVVWSSPILRSGLISRLGKTITPKCNNVLKCQGVNQIQVRTCKSAGGTFTIFPSTFAWNKTKDMLKFYIVLTSAPFIAILLYANVFIGPATLKPIPEGYEPKHWEYYSHPVSRFISRYLTENPQKAYEKMCFTWYYFAESLMLRELEKKVKFLISDRRDFQAWYYSPGYVKYTRNRMKQYQDHVEVDLQASGFPIYK